MSGTVGRSFEEAAAILQTDLFEKQADDECGHTGTYVDMAVCQNLVPLVNIKIAGKWMFIPLKMVLIGIDPYP
jgi:hypothetical protein